MATPQSPATYGPTQYTYEELAEAAHRFSNNYRIGGGGFGEVYEGFLDGKIAAIKKLKILPDQPLKKGLEHEIRVASCVSHRNLVKLVGYCVDGANVLLVLEYFRNKSLKFNLHEKKNLDWPKRMKIAIGCARGLEYLHLYCTPRIIHQDIKPDNILLDDNFEPKVADFGLALFFPDNVSHISTSNIGGTVDYIDPKHSGQATDKLDVYSFGVVLLELISGRPPTQEGSHIVSWAKNQIIPVLKGKRTDLIDSKLQNFNGKEKKEMIRMVKCAACCVYKLSEIRPTIKEIAQALEDELHLNGVWDDNDYNFLQDNPKAELSQTTMMKLPNNNNKTTTTRNPTIETTRFSNPVGKTSFSGSFQAYKPKIFTHRELRKATEDFSNVKLVGEGEYGAVYVGQLENKTIVAIKKLKDLPNKQQKEEFEKKIKDISSLKHSNLVNPVGYCIENLNRFLVSEFVSPSNSLKYYLHGSETLDWPKRMNIALGSANGLKYLHKGKIIHGDIKSNNIILDNNFEPKVTNFGLIMHFPPGRTNDIYSYSKDYKNLSEKSDVYTFGVLLLELVTGRNVHEKGGNIINWIVKALEGDIPLKDIWNENDKKSLYS
ncbi:hypothetical protein MANES_11G043600v8 [Manihot esculenta]|uniref:Uncharacterized protein n=1 Tax=Manihot esculenta TaxID=3983 RepID=A0ACB7GU61_MANES|nr:hypothetical protein MANES_11G043600v8 [Manihot esculenta]